MQFFPKKRITVQKMPYVPESRGSTAARTAATTNTTTTSSTPADIENQTAAQTTKSMYYYTFSWMMPSYGDCKINDVASVFTYQMLWLLSNIYSVCATRFNFQAADFPLKNFNGLALSNGAAAIGVGFFFLFFAKCYFKGFVVKRRAGGATYAHYYATIQVLWSAIMLGLIHLQKNSPYYQFGSTPLSNSITWANFAAFATSGLVLGTLTGGEDTTRGWRKIAGDTCFATFLLAVFDIIVLVEPLRLKEKHALFGMVAFAIICAFSFLASFLNDGMCRSIQFLALCSSLLSIAAAGCLTLDSPDGAFLDFQLGTVFTVVTAFVATAWFVRSMAISYKNDMYA